MMAEEKSINEELLVIIKALTEKVESLEKAVYNKDNLLMKSGFVVANTPTPDKSGIVGNTTSDIAKMDWSDIHKMVEQAGGN